MSEASIEVELRHPHKGKQIPLSSKVNLADDFYMDDDSDLSSELGKKVGPTVWDHILLNRPVKVVFAMLIAVLVIPSLLYGFMYGLAPVSPPFGSCVILPDYWSECMPGVQPQQQDCVNLGCCWNSTLSFCYHSLPARQNYRLSEDGEGVLTPRLTLSPLGRKPLDLKFEAGAVSENHALIHLFAGNSSSDVNFFPAKESAVTVEVKDSLAFSVAVWRKEAEGEAKSLLFSTDNGPLVATDGFWEWSLQFPEDAALLGAGASSRGSLLLNSGSVTLYQSLRAKTSGRPFILCILQSGKSHGVLFESQGALEIVARPSNLLTIRSTAGASFLKVHTFIGDDPAQVFAALTSHIGRPTLPPYWALGIHFCRDAARNSSAYSSVQFSKEALELELPYDSDCVDDSALGNVTFTVEPDRLEELLGAINILQQDGRHFIFSLFSQVSLQTPAFQSANEAGLFLGKIKGRPFLGQHRDEHVAYPDFDNPATADWLLSQMELMLENLIELPSGLALPDNWPIDELLERGDGPNPPHYVPQVD